MLYVQLRAHSYLISVFCSGIVSTGAVRPADMVGSDVSGTYCGECYIFALLCDVM
jgi:hypothetical protein